MTIVVNTGALYFASGCAEEMAFGVNRATDYVANHIEPSSAWGDGAALNQVLRGHPGYVEKVQASLAASRKLLATTSDALEDAAQQYDASEDDALASVRLLFGDLDPSVHTDPLCRSTAKKATAVDNPSVLLAFPESPLADPAFQVVWDVLNWPDYLSIGYWLREVINKCVQVFAPNFTKGQDVFEYLAQQLGGDWDKIALAGSAFGHLGEYFTGLSEAVNNMAVDMFSGWEDGDGARSAGEFLAELMAAFAGQRDVYDALELKYTDAATAAFFGCSTLLSALDALIDAIIAALCGAETILSAFAAAVTFGATLPESAVGAVIGLVEAFSTAWGAMMTVASGFIAVGAELGAANVKIEFLPLPEA